MTQAIWVKCPWCPDFGCTIHRCHAYDCGCPRIEFWLLADLDPYEPATPASIAFASALGRTQGEA